MKIAVCGKGGSGKSTVVSLLAGEFERKGKRVLVLDSDESNSGLHWMLGLDHPPLPLMEFVGGKKRVQSAMIARFSSGQQEPDMSILTWEEIPSTNIPPEYISQSGECRLVMTGKINQSLEGCACPMGTVTREFLKKLRLNKDEIVIVDMEAGIEHFGRGIETSIDKVVVVVEPSLESLSLAQKIKELASRSGAHFAGAILNKINSKSMSTRLANELGNRGVSVIGNIGYHQEILSAGLEGRVIGLNSDDEELDKISDNICRSEEVHSKNER